MQYKIPQNVGIEDKIVGPLTLRQLIILAIGFGISYVLFAIISKLYELNILEYIVIAIPAILAAAFALIRINDIPLTRFIFIFLEFSIKPKRRFWDHLGIAALVSPDLSGGVQAVTAPAAEDALAQKGQKATNLKDLTKVLDSGGFEHLDHVEHKDIDDIHDDDLMSQAYFGHKESKTGNMYWRTKESHIKMLDIFAKMPVTQLKAGTKEAAIAQKEIAEIKKETEQMKTKAAPKQATALEPKPTPPPAQAAKPASPAAPKAKPQQSVAPQATPPQKQTQVPPVQPANAQSVTPDQTQVQPPQNTADTQKKKRKRKRKIPQPVRDNNQINTTQKNQPAEYLPKSKAPKKPSANAPADKQKKPEADKKDGEFEFRELEKGEIEINLD